MADERSALSAELDDAQEALAAFARGPAKDAADALAEAFSVAGLRISKSLSLAAFDGEAAFRRLGKAVIEQFAKLAVESIFRTPAPTGKSEGAPPSFAAQAARGAAPVNVHFHLSGGEGADAVRRHQGQIAAQVARAAAYGQRNL